MHFDPLSLSCHVEQASNETIWMSRHVAYGYMWAWEWILDFCKMLFNWCRVFLSYSFQTKPMSPHPLSHHTQIKAILPSWALQPAAPVEAALYFHFFQPTSLPNRFQASSHSQVLFHISSINPPPPVVLNWAQLGSSLLQSSRRKPKTCESHLPQSQSWAFHM